MGQSTNAILWYGVALDGEGEKRLAEWAIGEGMEEETEEGYSEGLQDLDHEELEELLQERGVHLVIHCHSDFPMYGLAVAEPTVASRGYPEKIDTTLPPKEARAKFQLVMDAIGETAAPRWHLASMWS